jgi:hypothetical protein
MTKLDILIPFGLPPTEMSKDLLRELKTPSLGMLLARSSSITESELDPFSRSLPHEAWLANRLGLSNGTDSVGFPFAGPMMHSLGLAPESGYWFILQPAHFHVARDHIVLSDPRKLVLNDEESRTLFDSIRPLFEESGKTLAYGNARTWFMRADDWADLQTSTPEATSGHNIDIWMPKGSSARAWRKLLNEVQMLWHAHPLNEEREYAGRQPINSLWLWGGAAAGTYAAQHSYAQIVNAPDWAQAQGTPVISAEAAALLNTSASRSLAVLSDPMVPALAQDWSAWLEMMQTLEKNWFSALLDGLKDGKIEQLTLVFSHGSKLLEVVTGKNSLKKFWVKPSLNSLSR